MRDTNPKAPCEAIGGRRLLGCRSPTLYCRGALRHVAVIQSNVRVVNVNLCRRFARRHAGRDWSAPPTLVKRGLDVGPYCGEGTLKAAPDGALDLTIVNDWHPPLS